MLTVHDVTALPELETVVLEENRDIHSVFCCDMLSIAMAKAPSDSAWVTVMGNKNVIAVAALADVSCVIIAEGYDFDGPAMEAAKGKVTLLKSPLPVFETARMVHEKL